MTFPKELTTVTTLSKYLAMVVFIALPFVGFFLGMRYQEMTDLANKEDENSMKACTQEAMICPDGTSVGRQGPNCEFASCPDEKPSICPTPPTCPVGKNLIYGDPVPSEQNQCARYQCL